MNIDDFRYIVAIADLGSFTNAAKKLFIAQPSLSQRVKHIESTYNIIIFLRDAKKGIHLTEEGECFVRYAKQILRAEEDLKKELSDMHGLQTNTLRLGTCQLINSSLFDNVIRKFHEINPDVHFEFIQKSSMEVQELLQAGKIDIAMCYLPILFTNLKYKTVLKDRFVLVPAKEGKLYQKIEEQGIKPMDYVKAGDLHGEPFAICPTGTRLNDYLTEVSEHEGITPDIQHYSGNYSSLYSIAQAGIASTILFESFFTDAHEDSSYFYIDSMESDLSVVLAWRKNTYLQQSAKDLLKIADEFI